MTYDEFVRRRRAGTIRAGVDPSTAISLLEYLPKRYQYPMLFWTWVWVFSIPAFILVSVLWKWWAGLLLLVLVTPALFRANKTSAAQFVLEHAEEDREFFERLVENNLLAFRE